MARRLLRSQLYRDARLLGTLEAAGRGPSAYARRYARRRAYAASSSITRRLLRAAGLER